MWPFAAVAFAILTLTIATCLKKKIVTESESTEVKTSKQTSTQSPRDNEQPRSERTQVSAMSTLKPLDQSSSVRTARGQTTTTGKEPTASQLSDMKLPSEISTYIMDKRALHKSPESPEALRSARPRQPRHKLQKPVTAAKPQTTADATNKSTRTGRSDKKLPVVRQRSSTKSAMGRKRANASQNSTLSSTKSLILPKTDDSSVFVGLKKGRGRKPRGSKKPQMGAAGRKDTKKVEIVDKESKVLQKSKHENVKKNRTKSQISKGVLLPSSSGKPEKETKSSMEVRRKPKDKAKSTISNKSSRQVLPPSLGQKPQSQKPKTEVKKAKSHISKKQRKGPNSSPDQPNPMSLILSDTKSKEKKSRRSTKSRKLPRETKPKKGPLSNKSENPKPITNLQDVKLRLEPPTVKIKTTGDRVKHRLTNDSKLRLAIKLKCTDNKLYRLSPVFSVLEAQKSIDLRISRAPNALRKADEIVVECLPVEKNQNDARQAFRDQPNARKLTFQYTILLK